MSGLLMVGMCFRDLSWWICRRTTDRWDLLGIEDKRGVFNIKFECLKVDRAEMTN